jgi:hypothetical protein
MLTREQIGIDSDTILLYIPVLYCVFRCSSCDSLFSSLIGLEHHKEEFEHWSGEEEDDLGNDQRIRNTFQDSSDESETSELDRLI